MNRGTTGYGVEKLDIKKEKVYNKTIAASWAESAKTFQAVSCSKDQSWFGWSSKMG